MLVALSHIFLPPPPLLLLTHAQAAGDEYAGVAALVEADVMRDTLAHICTHYGGIAEYLAGAGFDAEWQQRLRDALRPALPSTGTGPSRAPVYTRTGRAATAPVCGISRKELADLCSYTLV